MRGPPGTRNGGGGRRVLVVEDHLPSRLALTRLLTNRKLEVTEAATAAEALELARAQSFDLVISDIGLPDLSGYDLMNTLRTKYGMRGIALSGYGTKEDIARSRQAGFVSHLTKPVQIQALDSALQQICDA
jgi:CheY-like chemotaxis protein